MRAIVASLTVLSLAACEPTTTAPSEPAPQTTQTATTAATPPRLTARQAQANFRSVQARVEPVAERECRARTPELNCDFKIIVESDPRLPPNAYQTLDRTGRPIIGFTLALIADARNRDELAFVMGHEAAHHISKHLEEQRESATGGAIAGGILAGVLGLDVETGARIGGTVGARAYSKENELEADALGTVIAKRAGYDPVRGALFFTRIPDPGDQFLGTHPPNAERIETVKRVDAQL